jgi:hypothetical protein
VTPNNRSEGATGPCPSRSKSCSVFCSGLSSGSVWQLLANLLIRQSMAGYAEAEPAMKFTLPMLLARLTLGGVSSVAAGFVCAVALRCATAVKFLASLLVLFFIPVHYSLWATFPVWYHALFLASIAPLTLLGAALPRPIASKGDSAA